MTTLYIHSHEKALTDIAYLISGHHFGEDRRDVTVVLDREDTLELYKAIDTSLYEEVEVELQGDYFYISSSVQGNYFIIEDVRTQDGVIKDHEGDILILPHYVPQQIRQHCVDESETVIELAIASVYDQIVKIIEA